MGHYRISKPNERFQKVLRETIVSQGKIVTWRADCSRRGSEDAPEARTVSVDLCFTSVEQVDSTVLFTVVWLFKNSL